jgi:hypothetical protein
VFVAEMVCRYIKLANGRVPSHQHSPCGTSVEPSKYRP